MEFRLNLFTMTVNISHHLHTHIQLRNQFIQINNRKSSFYNFVAYHKIKQHFSFNSTYTELKKELKSLNELQCSITEYHTSFNRHSDLAPNHLIEN